MNSDNHLELIKYGRFLEAGGSRDVCVKVATFGRTTMTRDTIGDVFDYNAYDSYTTISKFDPAISAVIPTTPWIAGIQGASSSKTDAQGNTYVVGVSSSTLPSAVQWTVPTTIYEGSTGLISSLSIYNPDGNIQMYIGKFSTTGSLLWIAGVGGGITPRTAYICFDSRNYVSVIVSGSTTGSFTTTLNNGIKTTHTVTQTPTGQNADMVLTFSRSGSLESFVQIVGVASTSENIMPVGTYDVGGNLYLTSAFVRSATLTAYNADKTTEKSLASTDPGSTDVTAYLAKFSPTSRALWIASPGIKRWRSSIGVDSQGNVYTAGYIIKNKVKPIVNADGTVSSLTLGTFMKSDDLITSGIEMLKFNPNGIAQWTAGADMPYVNEYDVGVGVNSNDEIFLTGIFVSTNVQSFKVYHSTGQAATFPWPTTRRIAGDFRATYYIKYNTSGAAQYMFLIENNIYDLTWVLSPIFDTAGNVIVAQGFKDDAIVFYNADATTYRTMYPPGQDGGAFIAKYSAANGAAIWADYACAGYTEIRDIAGGASVTDTFLLMNDTAPIGKTTPVQVVFADWSTMAIPPTKTHLIKVVHNPGFPPPADPLPISSYANGFKWSRFDSNTSFNVTTKDMQWFKGKAPANSGTVASIECPYTTTNRFSSYGIATGNGSEFALMYRAYFRPSRSGDWTFSLTANDVGIMWLGAEAETLGTSNTLANAFLQTDSTHSYLSETKTSATKTLVAWQYYPVLIYYGQSTDDSALVLTYTGPGVPNQSDGTGYFFYDATWPAPSVPGPIIPENPVLSLQPKELAATLANGAAVSTWGTKFIQASTSKRPIFRTTGGLTNGSYVSFTPSSQQFLYSSSPLTMNCALNGGLTYIISVRMKDPKTDWERILQGTLSTDTSTDLISINRDSSNAKLTFNFPGVAYKIPTTTVAQNTWYTYTVRCSNPTNIGNPLNNVVIKRDNVTVMTTSSTSLQNIVVNLGLGANIYGGAPSSAESANYGNIDIGAFIFYDRALSDADLSLLYDYVAAGSASKVA